MNIEQIAIPKDELQKILFVLHLSNTKDSKYKEYLNEVILYAEKALGIK